MKTTRELGRFLHDNRLRMRADLSKEGFRVVLLHLAGGEPVEGAGVTFPDAVDAAIRALARRRVQECLS